MTRWSPDSCCDEVPGADAVTALPHAAALQVITGTQPAPKGVPFRTSEETGQ
jgi:hypothetical protein